MLNNLPIDKIKHNFLDALTTQRTILLSAEPGAGKSTRLPLWLLDDKLKISGKIYLLQPRRVAVKNIALFLAQQIDEPVGNTVGYRLRNETKVSNHTKLEVITEGILVQLMQQDPEMVTTSIIMLDEFHERSLQADLAFALARDIQQGLRDDLTLVLMSATLASEQIQKALPDAYYLSSEGRSYPVSVEYQPITNIRRWREHALSVIKQAINQYQDSILVFLPGSSDIRYINQQLVSLTDEKFAICPLYGDLSLKEQQHAILPSKQNIRKLVLATNIAETSLTIEGVTLVIDCGLEKVAIYDENTLTNKLVQRNIAKSSAIQRMGRAGRLSKGHCIRLYSVEEYNRRTLQNDLPIQQADILPVVIEAARWGVTKLIEIPLLDFPSEVSELSAWQILQSLGVVNEQKRLTIHGEQVAKLACHARFAHMIIKAKELEVRFACTGLTYLACLLTALLEERDIFDIQQAEGQCDIRLRIEVVLANPKQYIYRQILKQAKRLLEDLHHGIDDKLPMDYTGLLLYLAFPERLAKSRTTHGEFIASYGKGLTVNHQDSLANTAYIVAAHLSQFKNQLMVRLAAPIELSQLLDWQLVELMSREKLNYDNTVGRIIAVSQQCIGAIVIEERKVEAVNLDQQLLFKAWQGQIIKQGLSFLKWRDEDKALLQRWRWVNQNQPELDYPCVSEQSLINGLDTWLQPYLLGITSKTQLNKLNLSTLLFSLLDYQQQQQFNKVVPGFFIGPTGKKCPIRYSDEHPPIVSLPMQEIYGMQNSPKIGAEGSEVNLTLEILSPAQRPIQITADLAGFWQGSYKAVQKEMKSKYPKHYWPDNPAQAKATNKTKRHLNNC